MSLDDGAVISPDGLYRYFLWRRWGGLGVQQRPMVFIMLNPSTADGSVDDPTIRRCVGFARREGCTGIEVYNLYAYRATNPKQLVEASGAGIDPVGPENDWFISGALIDANISGSPVVVAWGARGTHRRAQSVRAEAARCGVGLVCLGTTKDGHPRHPLYVKSDTPLEAFP